MVSHKYCETFNVCHVAAGVTLALTCQSHTKAQALLSADTRRLLTPVLGFPMHKDSPDTRRHWAVWGFPYTLIAYCTTLIAYCTTR